MQALFLFVRTMSLVRNNWLADYEPGLKLRNKLRTGIVGYYLGQLV